MILKSRKWKNSIHWLFSLKKTSEVWSRNFSVAHLQKSEIVQASIKSLPHWIQWHLSCKCSPEVVQRPQTQHNPHAPILITAICLCRCSLMFFIYLHSLCAILSVMVKIVYLYLVLSEGKRGAHNYVLFACYY